MLVLDRRSNFKGGSVSGIKITPILNQVEYIVVETNSIIKTMSVEINKPHKILEHCGETHLKVTANAYGIKVFGKLEACESCDISK
jgi:hypothetical protein